MTDRNSLAQQLRDVAYIYTKGQQNSVRWDELGDAAKGMWVAVADKALSVVGQPPSDASPRAGSEAACTCVHECKNGCPRWNERQDFLTIHQPMNAASNMREMQRQAAIKKSTEELRTIIEGMKPALAAAPTLGREATAAMVRAAHDAGIFLNMTDDGWRKAWRVMFDAALTAPEQAREFPSRPPLLAEEETCVHGIPMHQDCFRCEELSK